MTTDEECPEVVWSDFYTPDWEPCETCGHYSQASLNYLSDGSVEWRDEISCTSWEHFDGTADEFFDWFDETYVKDAYAENEVEMVDSFKEWLARGED